MIYLKTFVRCVASLAAFFVLPVVLPAQGGLPEQGVEVSLLSSGAILGTLEVEASGSQSHASIYWRQSSPSVVQTSAVAAFHTPIHAESLGGGRFLLVGWEYTSYSPETVRTVLSRVSVELATGLITLEESSYLSVVKAGDVYYNDPLDAIIYTDLKSKRLIGQPWVGWPASGNNLPGDSQVFEIGNAATLGLPSLDEPETLGLIAPIGVGYAGLTGIGTVRIGFVYDIAISGTTWVLVDGRAPGVDRWFVKNSTFLGHTGGVAVTCSGGTGGAFSVVNQESGLVVSSGLHPGAGGITLVPSLPAYEQAPGSSYRIVGAGKAPSPIFTPLVRLGGEMSSITDLDPDKAVINPYNAVAGEQRFGVGARFALPGSPSSATPYALSTAVWIAFRDPVTGSYPTTSLLGATVLNPVISGSLSVSYKKDEGAAFFRFPLGSGSGLAGSVALFQLVYTDGVGIAVSDIVGVKIRAVAPLQQTKSGASSVLSTEALHKAQKSWLKELQKSGRAKWEIGSDGPKSRLSRLISRHKTR